MSNVTRAEGVYLYDSNKRKDTVLSMIRKKIGRKKAGTFRLNLLSGRNTGSPAVASDVCIKFTSIVGEPCVRDVDIVTLDDLLYADLPWSGDIILNDDVLDGKYLIHAHVRNIVRFHKFIFQLRELHDGKTYADGLVAWNIYNLKDGFTYDIKTGLKQLEVVETFQDYYTGVNALKKYLSDTGYIEKENQEWHLMDGDGNIISKIDHSLLGVLFFKSIG